MPGVLPGRPRRLADAQRERPVEVAGQPGAGLRGHQGIRTGRLFRGIAGAAVMIAMPALSLPNPAGQGSMKLVLVVPSLGGGGAERVMATLANAWAVRGNEVSLITLTSAENDRYLLDRTVRRVALDMARRSSNPAQALGHNAMRVRALRRAIKAARPDAVISFVANTNALAMMAALGLGVPVIVTERQFVGAEPSRLIWKLLRRLLYRRAA